MTRIKYSLPADAHVKLEVFNLAGSKAVTLVNIKQSRGVYTVAFDGEGLSSGIYYYRLEAVNLVQVKRMVMVQIKSSKRPMPVCVLTGQMLSTVVRSMALAEAVAVVPG